LSDWAIVKTNITLNAGGNTIEFRANGAAPASVYFDGIVVVPTAYADGIVIQENQSGFDRVDGTIDSNFSGYTGNGFANAADTNGASIFWNAYFDSSVVKSFTFRYASTNDRTANLIVNGVNVASEILFPSTGSFATWDYVTVNAYTVSGAAEVRLQANSAAGLPHVDHVELIGGGAENAAPSLAAISNRTLGVGQTLTVTNSASDTDVPAQALVFSLLTGPANATLNTNSGILTWRPLVSRANTSNNFTVRVADNGSPSLSATQSFVVIVTNLVKPQITTATGSGNQLVLQVSGASGPDYQIQSSTNLVNWSAVFSTNSPAMPFAWTNPATGLPQNFFRIQVGPPLP
jgi:Putative Ig domain/Carbohydrate binding module (family 6)